MAIGERRNALQEFISEDDLKTFDGWLKYQGVDLETTKPDDLETWKYLQIRTSPSNRGLGSWAGMRTVAMVSQHGSMRANCHGAKSARPRMITNEIRSRELADPLLNECYRELRQLLCKE